MITPLEAAQTLVDEIMTSKPYCEYAKAHQLKLIDDKLALIDNLLDKGLVHINESNRCKCNRIGGD